MGIIPGDQSTAIGKLLNKPVSILPAKEETATDRVFLLQQRLKRLHEPPQLNPYQSNFHTFLTQLCWTADEAKGGKVALFPAYPYVKELCDAFIECDLLFIEKSRRVLASWACCCFDIWIAAGGQDPRWVNNQGERVLMNETRNRQVYVADRKFDSAARFLKRRHKFILDQFEAHDGWNFWPTFPHWECSEGEIEFDNNGLITAVAQGSDQLRGAGATLDHLEEIAFWEQAQQTVEGLLPTIQGGGHVVAISTPQSGSYAKRIVHGELGSTSSKGR